MSDFTPNNMMKSEILHIIEAVYPSIYHLFEKAQWNFTSTPEQDSVKSPVYFASVKGRTAFVSRNGSSWSVLIR